MLRVSVIIPAYNEEHDLPATLASLAAQTTPPFEVLVIDNNSTDHTADVVRSWQRQLPMLQLLHEPRRGVVFARNTGIRRATGDILARTDADTVLAPDWIANMTAFFAQPQHDTVVAVTGPHVYTGLPTWFSWLQNACFLWFSRWLFGSVFLTGPNMALRRRAVQQCRACQEQCLSSFGYIEDADLGHHMREIGSLAYVPTMCVRTASDRLLLHPWTFFVLYPLRVLMTAWGRHRAAPIMVPPPSTAAKSTSRSRE